MRSPFYYLIVLAAYGSPFAVQPVKAQESAQRNQENETRFDAAQLDFFEARIRPVLVQSCYSCHSEDAKNLRGGLLLDSREGLLKGGDSGPAVAIGHPEQSLLIKALKHDEMEMPPDKKLPPSVITDFEKWIRSGLADPRKPPLGKNGSASKRIIDIEQGRQFWSFRPVVRPAVPESGTDWARNDIDRFVAQKHASIGITDSNRHQ
ncbi:MAG: hypothetical protein FJ267_17085, partial [Planctomycetes bacterium]|nr:hypothetical protein [Planctomycetota bacterium]